MLRTAGSESYQDGQLRTLLATELPAPFEIRTEALRTVYLMPASMGAYLEPQAARQPLVSYPNVLAALDAGQLDGQQFLVTEYALGPDLRTISQQARQQARQQLPVEMALYLAREVARALHALHTQAESIHGAVAPSNVFCTWSGEVKLGDAQRLPRLLNAELAADRPGTSDPRYCGYQAAEQAWGAPPSRSGDIYGLGALLWELLAGRPLHDREPQLLFLDSAPLEPGMPQPGALLAPSFYRPGLSAALDALVLRALDSQPEERYATAAELGQELGRELRRVCPDIGPASMEGLLSELFPNEAARQHAELLRLLTEAQELSHPRVQRTVTTSLQPTEAASSPVPVAAPVPSALASPLEQTHSPEARLLTATSIDGRYRLRRLIGVGGMGAVYEAEHVAISKRVALKILHPQFSRHADLVERLRREAQAASRIGHPNIVDVTDFGRTEDGSAYLAMEYLHGTDLGAVLRARGRLPEDRTLHIGVQLVRALAAAHRAGIIHRDLKPENVFLVDPLDETLDPGMASDGVPRQSQDLVKVLDFGIAMQLSEPVPPSQVRPVRLTNPGLTVGTPEYMAPEQAMGQRVDPRADIYAVGTMLYEMLCGRVPFVASSVPELLTLKIGYDPTPPHLWLPGLSRELEAVVMHCLQRDPSLRMQSMEELERALQNVATELGVVLDPHLSGAISGMVRLPERTGGHALLSPEEVAGSGDGHSSVRVRERSESHGHSGDSQLPGAGPRRSGLVTEPLLLEVTARSAASMASVPPLLPLLWQRTLVVIGCAVGLVVVGFATAYLLPTRAGSGRRQAGHSGDAAVAVASVALPASVGQPVSATPSRPALPERPTSTEGNTAMLLEWARQAEAGGRYTAPPGDNLVELLHRIELLSPSHPEVPRLRDRAVAALVRTGREQLRQKQALAALQTYRSLTLLAAAASFPRPELVSLLVTTAHQHRRNHRLAMHLASAAVQVLPTSVPAQLALADALLQAGRRSEAAAVYQRALELHPRGSWLRRAALGRQHALRSDKQRALGPAKHPVVLAKNSGGSLGTVAATKAGAAPRPRPSLPPSPMTTSSARPISRSQPR